MRIVNKEFFCYCLKYKYSIVVFVKLLFGMTDIFGFPFSDDDEEEYTPPIDDNEGDKENDNYVVLLEFVLIFRFHI